MIEVLHEKFTIKLVKENFLALEVYEGQVIEAEDIRAVYKGYETLVGDNDYVVAVYGNPFSSISKEAKEIAVKEYSSAKRKKVAMISDNLSHILIIKFFILWNKPKTPIRIFKDENKAFDWLESSLD